MRIKKIVFSICIAILLVLMMFACRRQKDVNGIERTASATAKGMNGDVKVEVKVLDGKIVDVKAEGNETEGIGSKAIDELPGKIVENNSIAIDV